MKLLYRISLSASLLATTLATGPSAAGCSVCGCSLSSDWAEQGFPSQPGFEAGVRLEYFDQRQLRSGTDTVDRTSVSLPNDEEIQQRTLNRNTWLDFTYVAGPAWSVSLQIPHHDRFHTTIAEGDTDVSTSQARGLGDIRLIGRCTLHRAASSRWGLFAGLKLPTGRFDQEFAAGPQAGELLDRGLQLGTGTTDLSVGATWFGRPATEVGAFAQATLTQPLAARAGFLPPASAVLSGGLRWLNGTVFTPQLQLNLKLEGREHGAAADTPNSGSTVLHLSPGVTAELGARSSAFVFIQRPLYQRVNGLQLMPHWLLSTGVRCHW